MLGLLATGRHGYNAPCGSGFHLTEETADPMTTPASSRNRPARPPSARPAPDPFRFGWRWAKPGSVNGTVDRSGRVPLTPDDLLHPQEGDQIPENTTQERDRTYLAGALRLRLRDRSRVRVLSDCLVDWGVRGLGNHSPDLSVFDDVRDPEWQGGLFRVADHGARPVLVIEIVSPDAAAPRVRDNDVVIKVDHYYRARVPLYAIIDQEEEGGPRRLLGYRRGRRRYVTLPLDEQGRLLLEPVGLVLGLRANEVVCYDARTGEEILDLTGMAQTRAAEAQARQAAEAALAAAEERIRELEAGARRRRR
jgi:Uma2 family endonuclease